MSKSQSLLTRSDLIQLLDDLASIPPYDSLRCRTTDGLDEPSWSNGKRARLAGESLDVFQKKSLMAEGIETASADLICDLFHLVHSSGVKPLEVLGLALEHFVAEAG